MIPKFRAWHKELEQMFQVKNIYLSANEVIVGDDWIGPYKIDENIELMQWTGLNDTGGRHIYEGDILKIEDLDTEIGIVRFNDGSFWVDGPDTEYCGVANFTECPDYQVEIIGNIYENPELLNE